LAVICFIPLLIWLKSTGSVLPYFTGEYPPGQGYYVFSKLCGLFALTLINVQVILVLLVALGSVQIKRMHAYLGVTIVTLSLLHYMLFVTAVSIRQGDLASGLFTFRFNDFYHTYLSVGLASFILLIVVALGGVLRSKLSSQFSTVIHRFYFFVIIGVYLHSFSVGSEIQGRFAGAFFSIFGCIICALLLKLFLIPRRAENATA